MKKIMKPVQFRYALLSVISMLFFVMGIAQDSGMVQTTTTSTHTTTTHQDWYAQPWVWIVGGAVFILLLVALVRSGSNKTTRSDKVTITKKTE